MTFKTKLFIASVAGLGSVYLLYKYGNPPKGATEADVRQSVLVNFAAGLVIGGIIMWSAPSSVVKS